MFTYMISYITRTNYGAIISEMVEATSFSKSMRFMNAESIHCFVFALLDFLQALESRPLGAVMEIGFRMPQCGRADYAMDRRTAIGAGRKFFVLDRLHDLERVFAFRARLLRIFRFVHVCRHTGSFYS